MMYKLPAAAALLLLAACQPVEEEVVPVEPIAPIKTVFEERQPDLCHAANYTQYLGQPGTIVPSLGLTEPYRLVEWRGLETQDYNAYRIVFRLDGTGNIYNIDCG